MKHVCIIEDMAFARLALEKLLAYEGFITIESYASAEEAIATVDFKTPKLYLLDVNLSGKLTGIDFAREIRQHASDPIIFLTAVGAQPEVQKMLQIEPDGYVLKPYNKASVTAAISIAVSKFKKRNVTKTKRESIVLKDGGKLIRFFYDEIVYISSEGNYVDIHLMHHKKTLRYSLAKIDGELPSMHFFRIQKKFIVNMMHITEVKKDAVVINQITLPVSRSHSKTFPAIWAAYETGETQ